MIKKIMITGLAAAALAAPASAQTIDPGSLINTGLQIYNAVRASQNPYYYNNGYSPYYYNNGYYNNGYVNPSYNYQYYDTTPYNNNYYYYNNGYYPSYNGRYYIDRNGNRVYYRSR